MISSVLERLECAGGSVRRGALPQRWYRAAAFERDEVAVVPDVWSSGRVEARLALRADRLDDGVLVARSGTRASDEAIVWVGDLKFEPVEPLFGSGPDAAMASPYSQVPPAIYLHARGRGVDVEWRHAARRYQLDLTVPCRPTSKVTFENDQIDASVVVESHHGVSVARLRPYASLETIELVVDGELEFRSEPRWIRGLPVHDARGGLQYEDRFSPGSFHVRRDGRDPSVVVTIRVLPSHARTTGLPRPRPFDGATAPPCARTSGNMQAALPTLYESLDPGGLPWARALDRGLELVEQRGPVASRTPRVSGLDSDASLWWIRAARAVCTDGLARPGLAPMERRALRLDVVLPRLRAWLAGVVALASTRDLPRLLEGAARWSDAEGSASSSRPDRIAIESVALLHDALSWIVALAREGRDGELERDARRLALRAQRWFQASFWLARPDRPADVVHTAGVPATTVERLAALAIRPGMLIAASLPDAPLDPRQRRIVVRAVEATLLTECGVRTLDAAAQGFEPTARDQGAVHPWLLAAFAEASLRGFGPERGRLRALTHLLDGAEHAPEAWAFDQRWPVPIGARQHAPNGAEVRRARALLRRGMAVERGGAA